VLLSADLNTWKLRAADQDSLGSTQAQLNPCSACADSIPAGRELRVVEESKVVVFSFLHVVWDAGKLSTVDELIADDHVHHLTRRDVHGPEGVKQLVSGFRGFLPDLRATIKDLIAEGDKVVVYTVLAGTDTGAYMHRPPSGNPVKYNGIDIFRIRDSNIAERWGNVEPISMKHQIGAIT
jgi:predicted ester cyclase